MSVAPDPTQTRSVGDLLADLSLAEKVLLLEGIDSWRTNAIERLGIRSLFLTDGPHGVRKVVAASGAFGLALNKPSTAFPPSVTLASTWDLQQARRMGAAIARECLALGVHVLLAPGVNIKRNPLCGRNFEYYSEDPLLSGAFGTAFVQGVQGEGVGTSVKHLAANSNEDFRFVGDSLVDERALREIFLRAFERVVKEAAPYTVMCAYNALNGTFCSDNRELLTDILRTEWGFDGVVMTDWGATHDRMASINAGCDLDMPGQVAHNRAQLVAGFRGGRIAPEVLDEAVRRVLTLVERCGTRSTDATYDQAAHAALAAEIATDGAVLLTNDGTLPLAKDSVGLVVVGEMFERMRFQGAGSSLISPPVVVSPKQAFDRRGIDYTYARGYQSLASARDLELENEAVAATRSAGTVLFFGGLSDLEESEGFDRPHMRLGENQTALVERLVAEGANVVLVLFAGAPVALPFIDDLAAVLDMQLPGMHGGEATAALLFGEQNPSGKLTESWPLTAGDASSRADFDRSRTALYYESVYVGYRFYDAAGTRLRFPFGHGLSYTRFEYDDVAVQVDGPRVDVSATIANVGDRDGAEVVQVYVRNNRGDVFKPDKELRAFTKVRLAAGERETVSLSFELGDLSYWDVAAHDWVLENGMYEVLVAASAGDIRLSAPLAVDQGRASRSPYSREVDEAYATPPAGIPDAFESLLGREIVLHDPSGHLELDARLADARRSALGAIFLGALTATVRRDLRKAQRLPDSLERDARVKNTHFLLRMMPTMSLRAMAMASSGMFPYRVATGLVALSAWHPLRALRRIGPKTDVTRSDGVA
jgi:beta-glucosidase